MPLVAQRSKNISTRIFSSLALGTGLLALCVLIYTVNREQAGTGSAQQAVMLFAGGLLGVSSLCWKSLNSRWDAQMRLNEAQTFVLEGRTQELRKAHAKLTALATTDGLTGLKNHSAFQIHLRQEWENEDTPLSLILLNMDDFQKVNSTLGHTGGDKVLRQVAESLTGVAREADIAARFSGDEFALILPDTDAETALKIAERLRATLEESGEAGQATTASFGVTTRTEATPDATALLFSAHDALDASREQGGNQVIHSRTLREKRAEKAASVLKLTLPATEPDVFTDPVSEARTRQTLWNDYDAAIAGWARVLDMRDHETEGHSQRVASMTEHLARVIGLSEEESRYIRWGAILHDIGKIGIPDSILLKPGPLTEEEWVVMRRHPDIAREVLAEVPFLQPALDIPYCHHEKWDGTGYPQGLESDKIPLSARLFAVVDVWDALTSDRPYRKAWSERRTLAHLRALSGTHFDPFAVEAFLQMRRERKETRTPRTLKKAA